jgi:hypothetical protein
VIGLAASIAVPSAVSRARWGCVRAGRSDADAVTQVCHLVDDVTQARRWYRDNGSTQDLHALIAAQKLLPAAMSGIGFDPAGRSKLGVAGVRRVTALEDLNSASALKRYLSAR